MRKINRLPILLLPLLLAVFAFAQDPMAIPQASAEPVPGKPMLQVHKNQRMLVLQMTGNPDTVAEKAIHTLLSIYFRNATEAEKNSPILPRVRWVLASLDARKRDWIGSYALPISEGFAAPKTGAIHAEEWHYGLVAEILHLGRYDAEAGDLASLMDFIAEKGCTVTGDMEEEFLLGPGNASPSDPESYRTLMRFEIAHLQDFPKSSIPLSSLR
jgi:hypothetical protein